MNDCNKRVARGFYSRGRALAKRIVEGIWQLQVRTEPTFGRRVRKTEVQPQEGVGFVKTLKKTECLFTGDEGAGMTGGEKIRPDKASLVRTVGTVPQHAHRRQSRESMSSA